MENAAVLQHMVQDELALEPNLNAADIGVTVKEGVVTLYGQVGSYLEKYIAEETAKRVHGVRAVANELVVKLPSGSIRTDEDIAAAAIDALRSNGRAPADSIKITVSNGWVKLDGEVERQDQKEAAEAAIRHLTGVVGVTNRLAVEPQVSPLSNAAASAKALSSRRSSRSSS